MVYIKTKEGASLLVALLAAVIVAVTTTLLDVVWWMTLCAAAGVFVVMALVALFIIRKYVAYKLKPIYSIVLSRDVHTNEIFSELRTSTSRISARSLRRGPIPTTRRSPA